jgi:hypothetical protein
MIINAGLKTVVCSTAQGEIETYNVEDWVWEWRKKGTDITDDKKQYGHGLSGLKPDPA